MALKDFSVSGYFGVCTFFKVDVKIVLQYIAGSLVCIHFVNRNLGCEPNFKDFLGRI